MTDEQWVSIHEDIGHRVHPDKYECMTCGQRVEQMHDMTALERTIWVMTKYLPNLNPNPGEIENDRLKIL